MVASIDQDSGREPERETAEHDHADGDDRALNLSRDEARGALVEHLGKRARGTGVHAGVGDGELHLGDAVGQRVALEQEQGRVGISARRDAQPLLLAAGEPVAALLEAVDARLQPALPLRS